MKMEHLSHYKGSFIGIWKEGSEMHALEVFGNGAFL
jgi:hypothetical protein